MPVQSPHDLYGLPLEQFIPERTALAKGLRAEKRRVEAGEVAALRKPSVAAWAVNQLVRTQPGGIRALFEAGDDLIRAQSDAGAGRSAGDAMREASRRVRETTSELLRAAEGLLSADGHPLSQTTLERVADTLRAAAIDEPARGQVKDGCLTHELRFVGLGIGGGAAAAPSSTPARSKPDTGADEQQAAAEAARRRRAAALKAAREARAAAQQRATRAESERQAAEVRHEEALAQLQESERLRASARERAQQAAAELANAERALGDLEDE